MSSQKLLVAIAGMPGSGKSVVVDVAKEIGYDVVIMGNVVREETKRRDLELTPENMGKVMVELRKADGETVIAKRSLPRIESIYKRKVIVDGVRSLAETEEFRKHYSRFGLIAIHSPPEIRFNRIFHRKRSDDSADWNVFHERDMRELNVGLGNVIAMAEYLIVNDGDFENAKKKVRFVLRKVEQKWKK